MKRLTYIGVLCLLIMAALALPCRAEGYALKGVWVSSVYNLDYPSAPGLSADALRREADAILDNAAAWGLDTVFLQVRPSGDALYSSDIFPWSHWLIGTQGVAPDGGFDPLAYFIQRAHGLDMEIHAWINPYRITRTARDSREAAFEALAPGHPALGMPQAVLYGSDGCLYFDPGRPESRALIVAGVMEIVERYDVDGVHLDDYFYPGGQFDDSETFALYGDGYTDMGDFRRASVTQLIRALEGKIHGHSEYLTFGVSPFGIWANRSQHADGSATAGDSSYFSHYADTRAWVREGLVDYIMPQLYWQTGSREADFDTLIDWWSAVALGTDVRLYIGLAAYRAVDAQPDSVWFEADELKRQLIRMEQSIVSGVCLFRYGSVAGTEAVAALATDYFAQPVERYILPWRASSRAPELVSPLGTVQVAAGGKLELALSAPAHAAVHVLLEGGAGRLTPQADGMFRGTVATADTGATALRKAVPMTLWEQDGLVSACMLPLAVEIVSTGEAAALTGIEGRDIEGGHEVFFRTPGPVAAQVARRGTTVELTLWPVAMAVLFEDAFFEDIDVRVLDSTCVYTLLLPLDKADWRARMVWHETAVTVILEPPGEG